MKQGDHDVVIQYKPRGYYAMFVDGIFFGNFDSHFEATQEYKKEYKTDAGGQ